jgi:hypothetical protein
MTIQYQGVWTLPVAARLQSTQQWATDPLYRNTTLLLQADDAANGAQNNTFIDSSSNNFTITRNGNTTQGTFTPFSATGWSNFFNGSNAYLNAGNAAALQLTTQDFTIEFWYNPTITAFGHICGTWRTTSGASIYTWLVGGNSTSVGFSYSTSGSYEPANDYIVSAIVNPFQWTHIAIVRNGSTITIFKDGVVAQTKNTMSNIASTTQSLWIGGNVDLQYFGGYLSNLRLLKGTALYTSNFTPSTSPLTAITNTSLLTCQSNRFVDNSTNNFTITPSGTPSVQAFSPFAPQFQWTAPVIGGSGYFDGTGDYLTAAANAAFQFGTGNFTIEYWYYPTVFGTNTPIDMGYANTGSYVIQNASDGKPYFYSGSTGLVFTATTGYLLNAWNHLAVTRSGTTLSMFINGVRVGTATNSTNFNANFALGIGGSPTHSTVYEVTGYLSSVRLLKGTAVYDPTLTTLTVPTAPLTAITNTSLLLNFTNAGIVDGTMKNNLETVGNAQVNTSIVKYGTGSMYFDGSGDILYIPYSPNFNFGTGDFTVEFWILRSSGNGYVITCGNDTSTGNWNLVFSSGSLFWQSVYGITNLYSRPAAAISDGAWHHVAITRLNGVQRMFFDGVQQGATVADTNNYVVTTTTQIGLGINGFTGYLDDFRITKGVARYTANFTPPTVALPRQ